MAAVTKLNKHQIGDLNENTNKTHPTQERGTTMMTIPTTMSAVMTGNQRAPMTSAGSN